MEILACFTGTVISFQLTSLLSVCLTNHVFVFSLTSYLEALIMLGAMDVENAISCVQSQRYVYKYSLKNTQTRDLLITGPVL